MQCPIRIGPRDRPIAEDAFERFAAEQQRAFPEVSVTDALYELGAWLHERPSRRGPWWVFKRQAAKLLSARARRVHAHRQARLARMVGTWSHRGDDKAAAEKILAEGRALDEAAAREKTATESQSPPAQRDPPPRPPGITATAVEWFRAMRAKFSRGS
jgi:hypothetical protein